MKTLAAPLVLIFAAGLAVGWLARPALPTPPTVTQYEMKRTPGGSYFQAQQLPIVEWQMCQLGQKFYCAIINGDDTFTAHLKAEGRWYAH